MFDDFFSYTRDFIKSINMPHFCKETHTFKICRFVLGLSFSTEQLGLNPCSEERQQEKQQEKQQEERRDEITTDRRSCV